MKNIIIIFAFVFASYLANAQFVLNTSQSLYSDVKAFKPGDAITVYITEQTSADNSAQISSDKSHKLDVGLDIGAGAGNSSYDVGLGTANAMRNQGSTSRNERITSKLSAKVIGVDPNGNLQIEGKRTTKVNGETQTITIKGTVRTVDILPNNAIYSYSVMDLTLFLEGDGTVSQTQEMGLITKFLSILF